MKSRVEIYSWKFPPYQTLSDLCAPKTIRNHFRLLLKFMRRLDFSAEIPHQHLRGEKSMVESCSLLSDGWMADGSFKIWITQFKVAVVFVLNSQTPAERTLRVSKLGRIARRKARKIFEPSRKLQQFLSTPAKLANNSDWWIISPLCLRSRFNCVEGIILKSIIFNFHRKFLPP